MINDELLKNDEKAIYLLRQLYRNYGYLPFKMSKFEEYDLYLSNKDFLTSDKVITFTDTDGTLLALKPDVTLSIVKNFDGTPGIKRKVFYNENVYRVSGSNNQFKEIMQTGLECLGDIDLYDIFEVILLAIKSLGILSTDYILDISHLGIISSILNRSGGNENFKSKALKLISQKNKHDLKRLCAENNIFAETAEHLCSIVDIYGPGKEVLSEIKKICTFGESLKAYEELEKIYSLLEQNNLSDKCRFDFTVIGDMNYYSGIVFKGFISGVCESILSGGQYDKLMHRMGKKAGALGFAIYLDLLEAIDKKERKNDVDVLLLYDNNSILSAIQTVLELTNAGQSVCAQKEIPTKVTYGKILDLR